MLDYTKQKNALSGIISGDSKYKMEEFIAEMQGFSLGLRLSHWETTNYELHKATELTQNTIDELLDDFAEACMGMLGGERPHFKHDITANADEEAILKCLKDLQVKDTAILNIRDEMLQAVYKYKFLKTLK